MSLFEIKRYDEELETADGYDHLSELLKKIEERKKQRIDKNESDKNEKEKPKKKRKKKSKKKIDDGTNDVSENNDNEIEKDVSGTNNDKDDNNKEENEKNEDDKQDFMILGVNNSKKKTKVTRVLPKWLTHPEIISADLTSGPELDEECRDSLKLDEQLVKALEENGIKKLFPVQLSLIKWMLKCNENRSMGWWPRDTCVSAPTGSGKTLAYVLPVIQQLKNNLICQVRCLIVLPVQELAAQVNRVMLTYCKNTNLKVALITGAAPMEIEQLKLVKKTQNGDLISKVDIVISTPGRLVDHIEKTQGFTLKYLEFLIIDEADRSTDWLKYIPHPHYNIPALSVKNLQSYSIPPAQKLLFSATLSQDPEKLSRLNLFQPILFTSAVLKNHDNDEDIDLDKCGEFLGKYTSPVELTERAFECSAAYKPVAALKLVTAGEKSEKTLIFTNSGKSAHRLALLLGLMLKDRNIPVDELSAQMMPKQRNEVLEKFSKAQTGVLVSSDALARGVDIPDVTLVISYDLPKYIKGYIHRSGRTGRAGKLGTAISILTNNQISAFNRMLASARKVVPTIETFESLETVAEEINYADKLTELGKIISKEEVKSNSNNNNNNNNNKNLEI
ncbi:putative ATP-dependent RNA helicase Dbp73D [Cotesia typhae]|uniref:putative ATP-dependent RNA helicase Dbp73D n=1 Tax=Cotesia typhae TaxID=2053667 RepID=UPI003D6828DB